MREYRRIPVDRLISRLGLRKYKGANIAGTFEVKTPYVHVSLRQHIGKSANPIVSVGDRVSKGQLIGEVKIDELGANIHSSIDGKVCEVSDCIVIKSENNEVIL